MLKRNDLAKQFELVVQQEIKNHQDSVSSIHQANLDLVKRIENIEINLSNKNAALESKNKSLEIEIDLLKSNFVRCSKNVESKLNDLSSSNNDYAKKLEITYQNSLDSKDEIELIINFIYSFEKVIKDLEAHVIGSKLIIDSSFDILDVKFRSEFNNFKNEVLNLPNDNEKIRKEFEEKIDSHRIDVAGIMKEIVVFKKSTMIVEKQIENIYTLIQRLKDNK